MRRALLLAMVVSHLLACDALAEALALKVGSAEAETDSLTGAPVVLVTLLPESAEAFGAFTRAHVGKQIKVRLGDTLLTEPVIREPILGGKIVISGNFTAESARDLATTLRGAGSGLVVESEGE